MAKMNVRKGDTVEVLSGKDKGARGEVLRALPAEGKVVDGGLAYLLRWPAAREQRASRW